VLDAGTNPLFLQTFDIPNRDFTRQIGVFGKALEVAASERRTVHVDGRCQKNMRTFGLGLFRQGLSDFFDQFGVPGCPHRHTYREHSRLWSHITLGTASAVGAIRNLHGRNPQPFVADVVPQVSTRQHDQLLIQGHLFKYRLYLFFHLFFPFRRKYLG